MIKAVVFGGSGFLGSYVADELSRRGYDVVVADIKEPVNLSDGQRYFPCDILDADRVSAALDGAAIVYNFAGMANLDECLVNPRDTMTLNVVGNVNILEACANKPPQRFVYASSAYALSNKGGFYGISKHASERIVREYAVRHDLKFSIIRYGSLYGARADSQNGIYRLLHQALTTGRIIHNGDGEEVREYIHAADAARLSVDIVENDQFVNEHVVLTGVERLKQKDILQMIREITEDRVEIEFTEQTWEGHYRITPYSYHPELGKKLIANPFIDLGQGLVDCVKHIMGELSGEAVRPEEENDARIR
jgi:UDP-glucose 4-epimerase